ncbi:tetratricopeptide repeat-containing response regulator [Algicola sagamiensis]|uniref:tetratricopeptide repeat-containing response regulator n=1 Tax=Algicola sagamiensis TaxID=163869 RepID=UPI00036A3E35|nr:tetratricopeptide repeat-containing response regulator [Algicola sagamiensis]
MLNYQTVNILVVDDQRPFQLMIKGMLQNLGAKSIQFASTGEQALQKCNETMFDMLFVDYNLGPGKNGRQLLEDLRNKQLLKPLSVYVIVTGDSSRPMVIGAVECQPDDYLIKPFSQSLLKSRVQKVYDRKKALAPVFSAIETGNLKKIAFTCEQVATNNSRYRQHCLKLLSDIFIKHDKADKAKEILSNELQKKRVTWALLAMARIERDADHYDESLKLCEEVLSHNSMVVDAYDIKAQNYIEQNKPAEALKEIKHAADLSPYSIDRQHMLCDVARENGRYDLVVTACATMMDMTKRITGQEPDYLVEYMRSILDAVEHSEDSRDKGNFLQEFKLALQRCKKDEQHYKDFNYSQFEQLCQARMQAITGKLQESKKTLYSAGVMSNEQNNDLPIPTMLLPDCISVLLNLGEFEQAQAMTKHLPPEFHEQQGSYLLEENMEKCKEKMKQFNAALSHGINNYKESAYIEAIEDFDKALELAPMNTGAALNLIQAIMQLIKQDKKQKTPEVQEKCKATFGIVDGIELPEEHQKRYKELKAEFDKVFA